MTNTIQQAIQKGLIGIILVLACISLGCSHSSKVAKPTPSSSSKKVIKPTPPSPRKEVKPIPPVEKAKSPEKAPYFVHKIQWRGETLSIISKWYTGKFSNWKTMAQANPQLNPNCMLRGDKLLIPTDLLKTQKPLPKEFVAKCTVNVK